MNVILYVVDALAPHHLGCYGYKRRTSPNIDEFASGGYLFKNAFAQSSWTKPSAPSLLTSTYPSVHGVSTYEDALSPKITTLADHLTQNGYRTAGFSAMVNVSSRFGFDSGFQTFHDLWEDEAIGKKRSTRQLIEVERLANPDAKTYHALPLAEDINEKVFTWLEKRGNSDFFFLIWAIDTHDPYSPPKPFDELFTGEYNGEVDGSAGTIRLAKNERDLMHLVDLYDGEIAYFDGQFGAFIRKLKEMGLYDSTLLVLTSDHGEVFRVDERIRTGHGGPPYDEQIRVPLIMRIPGFAGGKRIPGLAQSIDIMPTILDILGNHSNDNEMQGTNLLPLIRGESLEINNEIYSEKPRDWVSIRTRTGKCTIYLSPSNLRDAFSSKKFLMKYMLSWTRKQFFDLKNDPDERVIFEIIEGKIFGLIRFSLRWSPDRKKPAWRTFMKHVAPFARGLFTNYKRKSKEMRELEHKLKEWQNLNAALRKSMLGKNGNEKVLLDEEVKKRLQDLGYLD